MTSVQDVPNVVDNGSVDKVPLEASSLQNATAAVPAVGVLPSYPPNSRYPDNFNKENLLQEDEATYTKLSQSYFPTNCPYQPVQRNVYDDSHCFPMPVAMPPLMRYSSSAAFSDITMPFPYLTTSKSMDRNACLQQPQMTELLQYTSSAHLYGISPPSFSTPMHADASSTSRPPFANTFDHYDQTINHHQESGIAVTNTDLTLAASALLNLTPAVVNKSFDNASFSSSNQKQPSDTQTHHPFPPEPSASQCRDVHVRAKHDAKLKIVLRAQELLDNIPFTLHACKCKTSHCLKLYCNCFQSGTFCDELICSCRGCANTAEHSVPRGARTRAIYEILNRRLDAFDSRPKKKVGQGCSCKKSRCLQKYCDCYANGTICTEKCWCYECANVPPRRPQKASSIPTPFSL